ncbi:hsp70-binding protein 1 [Chelonus insularis]|uniref:hsp70-binding protein 1 n=1 Tax=Chelonus insularis TaxID=460826 RepID=UPI00158D6A7B|nr:hsp70-binding protein 1-like [Chelonus insularis]XP_034952565.1 hsp70-binding protein 1-like [Chelonus insularis]
MEDKDKSKTESSNSNSRPLSIQAPPSPTPVTVMENQPRQPTSLHGLLKFAMDATKNEDAPHESHFQPLDEERKKFLNDALNSLTVNVIEELKKSIKILSNVMELRSEDDATEYETALECIASYVDSMDVAVDFYKIGGFGILGACLNSPHDSIRWKAADVIAELTQNNPYCQDKILQMGLVPILLSMVDTDPSDQAKIKALYAISCIVRGNALSLKYMDVNDGYSVLIRAMQSSIQKLQIKSAFLISALCSKENAHSIRSSFIKMGIIEQASALLASSDVAPEIRDALLSILNSLTADNNLHALRECRRPELSLKSTLERHLENLTLEKATDEIEQCQMILDRIFADQQKEQDR